MAADDPDPQAALARHIVYVRPEELDGAERNPKGHHLPDIKAGVLLHGFTAPAVLDERTSRLVAGHGRRDAVAELEREHPLHPTRKVPDGIVLDAEGRWTMPVVRGWASRDDEHAAAMLVLDNRSTENGGWDDQLLAELLEELADYSADLLASTGFSQDDLDALLRGVTSDGLGNAPPEEGEDPDTAEDEEDREAKARSDGSLLALADASVAEPVHEVHAGDVWLLGTLPHTLAVAEVHTQWPTWVELLRPDMLLIPYAGPYTPLTKKAEDTPLLMVQPDPYMAGHVLDKYTAVHGGRSVRRAR